MEETTREYIKTNIDVLMNWLEFQGSFGYIKSISSFDFSPKVCELKREVEDRVEEYLETKDTKLTTTLVNQIVIKHIVERLQSNNLNDAVPFILNIDESKVIELATALFIRRSVLNTLSKSELIELDDTNELVKVFNEYLYNLRWLRLSASMIHDNISENLLSVYMESLPINLDNTKSSISYVTESLFYIERLTNLYKRIKGLKNIEIIEEITKLQSEIDEASMIYSLSDLTKVMTEFNQYIESLKTKIDIKTLNLV